jgi:hypothetical protein
MVELIPYFAGFIMILFACGFAWAITDFNKKSEN